MRPTEIRLIGEVDAEPDDDDRLLVYADWLQMRGDPRGELIALDVHARAHGTRDPRARELEAELETALLAKLDLVGGIEFGWRGGFLRDVIIPGKLVEVVAKRAWLADPAFTRLRSLAIDSTTDSDPLALVASAPNLATLERFAFGNTRLPSPSAYVLQQLIERLPQLHDLELAGASPIEADQLETLAEAKLEALALWIPCNDTALERVLQAPFELVRLTVLQTHRGPTRPCPEVVLRLLSGHYQPRIERLALMSGGYERALIQLSGDREIATRLKSLGLDWSRFDIDDVFHAAAWLRGIELVWPRPLGTPPDPQHDLAMSRRFLSIGRMDDALEHARRACSRSASNYHAWLQLAHVYNHRHEIREALEATTHALNVDRDGRDAWTYRGHALLALGRNDEARLAFERCLEIDPRQPDLYLALGRLHGTRGRLDEAIAAFERTAALSTGLADEAIAAAVELICELDQPARVRALVERHPTLEPHTLVRLEATRLISLGEHFEVLEVLAPAGEHDLAGSHLCAAALRGTRNPAGSNDVMRRLILRVQCPALIAGAWLGLALGGEDAFAVIASHDPALIADQIADHVNAHRAPGLPAIHTTASRPFDRIYAAAYAIAAAAVLRPDEVSARITAFADWLDMLSRRTVQTSYADFLLFAGAGVAAPAWSEHLDTLYQVIGGRLPPHVLRQV